MGVTSRVVVLASGQGSNLRALFAAAQVVDAPFEIVGVVSDKHNCGAIAFAKSVNIPASLVPFERGDNRLVWDQGVCDAIASFEPDWVVLAGFMRIVGEQTVRAFEQKMINIHPSLLPSFRGLHAVRQALDAGVRVTGCTVHFVDHDVDTGPIIGQAAVAVISGDDENSLQARIQEAEHRLLPRTLAKLCGRDDASPPEQRTLMVL